MKNQAGVRGKLFSGLNGKPAEAGVWSPAGCQTRCESTLEPVPCKTNLERKTKVYYLHLYTCFCPSPNMHSPVSGLELSLASPYWKLIPWDYNPLLEDLHPLVNYNPSSPSLLMETSPSEHRCAQLENH